MIRTAKADVEHSGCGLKSKADRALRRRANASLTAELRQAVRCAAADRGALWLRAVLRSCGVPRIGDLKGEPLRVAATVLVNVATLEVSSAYTRATADYQPAA